VIAEEGLPALFVVPTSGFTLLHGLVIIRFERRHSVPIGVTSNPISRGSCASKVTEAQQMSQLGQKRRFRDVRDVSG
jgi:hypothetical protein